MARSRLNKRQVPAERTFDGEKTAFKPTFVARNCSKDNLMGLAARGSIFLLVSAARVPVNTLVKSVYRSRIWNVRKIIIKTLISSSRR